MKKSVLTVEQPGSGFAAALHRLAPTLSARAEEQGDAPFLAQLFQECSPLRGLLPDALLADQARLQRLGHRAGFPAAHGHVVMLGDRPIGRMLIDDGAAHSLAVDVAVSPGARLSGAGLAMLRAWIRTADARGVPCRLRVLTTNPVVPVYRRLGFDAMPAGEDGIWWVMQRSVTAIA